MDAPAMLPLVLDLEKQAAALVEKARTDADAARDAATRKRDADTGAADEETAAQVQRIAEEAARVRDLEVNKLRSEQGARLAAVRDLRADRLDAGVKLVLDRLREIQA